ncbi:MAG: hypothetical protein ACREGL_01685, partial [Alphaproteobacteria bacterium]
RSRSIAEGNRRFASAEAGVMAGLGPAIQGSDVEDGLVLDARALGSSPRAPAHDARLSDNETRHANSPSMTER